MGEIHQQGNVFTELNPKKGLYCEWCGKDCTTDHLIRLSNSSSQASGEFLGISEPSCTDCAIAIINCLQLALADALITEKPSREK